MSMYVHLYVNESESACTHACTYASGSKHVGLHFRIAVMCCCLMFKINETKLTICISPLCFSHRIVKEMF
jgi:hypothetical protein